MNGHQEQEANYEFTRKLSNSFAESILASSPGKAHGAMGDGCDSGEGEQEAADWPQHPALLHCSRKEGDSGFISPEGAAAGPGQDLLAAQLDFGARGGDGESCIGLLCRVSCGGSFREAVKVN
jgi:hypothetical protein